MVDIDWEAFARSEYSTIAVRRVVDERPYGVVELREGTVGCLIQKPRRTDLAIVGCYFIRESTLLFECLHDLIQSERRWRGEYQLTDALQQMVELDVEIRIQEIEFADPAHRPSKLDNYFSKDYESLSSVLA